MRNLITLVLLPIFLACSTLEEIGTPARDPACIAAPWTGLDSTQQSTFTNQNSPVLRTVTYNIHSGMGEWKLLWSWRSTVERYLNDIADDIAAANVEPVDIVALNEVDFSARRSGNIDQARYLADALEHRTGARYHVVSGHTRQLGFPGFTGAYGNAVLVRHTVLDRKSCLYDDLASCGAIDAANDMPNLRTNDPVWRWIREARGVIKLTIDFNGRAVDVVVTHLEAMALSEREAQATHLLRRLIDPARTTVVLGDMNAVPAMMTHERPFAAGDRTHDILTSGSLADARVLVDARLGRATFDAWSTFPSNAPAWPLDTAFASLDLLPDDVRVIGARQSDHLGFYASYRFTDDAALHEQRLRHDTIRERQLSQILACNTAGATRTAALQWLRTGTRFLDTPALAVTPVGTVSEL
jgi:endonuclease/exonuclease/phosphatase family metal-dependent hydrolase